MANGIIEFSDDEEAILYKDIFSGEINLFNLPVILYRRIAKELTTTVFKAFNITEDTNLQHPDFATPRALKRNLYDFSAAKDFQQIRDMQNFIFNEKGFKRSFDEFEAKAKTIFDTYNRNWLQAEFETAARMSESSVEWEQIQAEKDIFPFLKYNTLEDNRVRQTHQTLNNIVKPVDDPFWDIHFPPNGWRCRCFHQQLSEGDEPETDLNKRKIEAIDPLFRLNPGKKNVIFQMDGANAHPYTTIDGKSILKSRFKRHAENNYGLPLPNDIK